MFSPLRLSYGSAPQQFGDLWLPQRGDAHPVAIIIHGGFWFNAYDLELMTPVSRALADAGIAAWNIEYRRIGDAGGAYPGTFLDNALAADFLQTLAQTYSLDLNRVITLGHSAGGHLALWLAARDKIPAGDTLYAPSTFKLRAAISSAGVADLRRGLEMKLGGGAIEKLLDGSREEKIARLVSASPAELLPFGVKQILIHGTKDDRVPYQISAAYQTQAIARGDDARLVTLHSAGHFEAIDPRSREWQVIMEAVKDAIA